MDIAAMSMALSQAKVQQQASVSVMKMAMDGGKSDGEMLTQQIDDVTKAMTQSVQPHLGANLDIQL